MPGTSAAKPMWVDAMLVTHGDADHFVGLVEIRRSEALADGEPASAHKRVFIEVARVLHNGLVKRPEKDGTKSRPERDMFGKTVERGGTVFVTELAEDLLAVAPAAMNNPFRDWQATLAHWQKCALANGRAKIAFARVDHSRRGAFDFLLEPGMAIDPHGPLAEAVDGAPALMFLNAPDKSTEMHLSAEPAIGKALSASHTINGHSLAFRLGYKNLRVCFTGDLNQQAMARLRARLGVVDFQSEILEAPHHGSADFDLAMLRQVAPVVSLISSGDESARTEFIHPLATLMSALGRVSRGDTGAIFCIELAAFFAVRGMARPLVAGAKPFFAFERTNFGTVHLRNDGERVLAFTHSGKQGVNEGYAFTVAADHAVSFAPSLRIVTAPPKPPPAPMPARAKAAKPRRKVAKKPAGRKAAKRRG